MYVYKRRSSVIYIWGGGAIVGVVVGAWLC